MPVQIPHTLWTPDERHNVEEAMGTLVPGYRLTDFDKVTGWLKDNGISDSAGFRQVFWDDPFVPNGGGDGVMGVDGIPEAWFWIAFWRCCFPMLAPHPLMEIRWWAWTDCGRGKGEWHNFWGAASTAKTSTSGQQIITWSIAWGRMFTGYVTGPWKVAASDKMWGDAVKKTSHLIRNNKESQRFLGSMGTRVLEPTDNKFLVNAGDLGMAETHFVATDKAASIQGKKSDSFGVNEAEVGNPRIGVSGLFSDEVVENGGTQVIGGWDNFGNNANAYAVSGCNPSPLLVRQPNIFPLSQPVDRDEHEMSRLRDWTWSTKYGRVFRLGWLMDEGIGNLPNMTLGRNEYPFLFSQQSLDRKQGKDKTTIAAQVEAWGFDMGSSETLTTYHRRKKAGCYENFAVIKTGDRVLALDPSHGGADEALIGDLEAVDIMHGPDEDPKRVIKARPFRTMQTHAEYVADDQFWGDLEVLVEAKTTTRADADHIRKEADRTDGRLGSDYRLAVDSALICLHEGVPPSHFTFDSSQRADFTNAAMLIFGRRTIRWFYEGTRRVVGEKGWRKWPYETHRAVDEYSNDVERDVMWEDRASWLMTPMLIELCEAAHMGMVVGVDQVESGFKEIENRPLVAGKGGKVDVLSKTAMKAPVGQVVGGQRGRGMKSPARSEVLAMAFHMLAHRMNDGIQLPGGTERERIEIPEVDESLFFSQPRMQRGLF